MNTSIDSQHCMTLTPEYIVVHHSATSLEASPAEITAAHIERGFDAIGYHYLIDAAGLVIAGRPEHIQGAHALGLNENSLGVCCIGNCDELPPTAEQVTSLEQLLVNLSYRHNIHDGYIIGHSDVVSIAPNGTPTKCPGAYLYALLPKIRDRVRQLLGEKLSAPELSIEIEDDSAPALLSMTLSAQELLRLRRRAQVSSEIKRVSIEIRPKDESVSEPVWSTLTTIVTAGLNEGEVQQNSSKISAYCPLYVLPAGMYFVSVNCLGEPKRPH